LGGFRSGDGLSATRTNIVGIRDATSEDAVAACQVLRDSISQLCVADHGSDPAILKMWLANKTPDTVAAWAVQKGSSLLLAVEGNAILGVGSVTDAGEITLNYVVPAARFRGVSRALLQALEARAVERGNRRCRLTSTETAHRFYQTVGYVDDGAPSGKFGMRSGYPMSKQIVGAES
jgi:GNAT superfamily N-acetyltransferase